MRPLLVPAIGLGSAYLIALVLLGPLLGSAADASTAFTVHFSDDGNRARDLFGSLALLVAAGMLVWTGVSAWRQSRPAASALPLLAAIAAAVTASAIAVSAGLLLTVPVTTAIGDLTDDPGIDPAVQAGIAQAGTVMLLVAALCLAATTVILARLGRHNAAVPKWLAGAAWITAGALCLGVTVALLLPFAAWAIALGLVWKVDAT